MRGHATYHPSCPHCVASRGVTRHPRSSQKQSIHVQADFALIEDEKFLCLWEAASKARGYIHIRSNVDVVKTEVQAWLRMIGLNQTTYRIYVRSDSEPALTQLLSTTLNGSNERSAPQSPETTGGAEKAVRTYNSFHCPAGTKSSPLELAIVRVAPANSMSYREHLLCRST